MYIFQINYSINQFIICITCLCLTIGYHLSIRHTKFMYLRGIANECALTAVLCHIRTTNLKYSSMMVFHTFENY